MTSCRGKRVFCVRLGGLRCNSMGYIIEKYDAGGLSFLAAFLRERWLKACSDLFSGSGIAGRLHAIIEADNAR